MPAPSPSSNLDEAVRDYVAGESCQVVATRHRVGQERVRAELQNRGLWRTGAESRALAAAKVGAAILSKSALPGDEIAVRYVAGESVNALADAYGVSRRAIDYRLQAAGVTKRDITAANRLMMARRTPEENAANVQAAHDAVRGTPKTIEHKSKSATTRERLRTHTSKHELELTEALRARGLDVVPQKAVGPYNVDIATGTVAVEVFGGGWHGYGTHRRRAPERLRYILDQGWNLVVVWTSEKRYPIGPGASDYIVAFAKLTGENPTMRGEYRMIWGDGQDATSPGLQVDDLSVKPSRSGRHRTRPGDDSAG